MRAPGYWQNPADRPGLMPRLLGPLGALYAMGTARRIAAGDPLDVGVPVICVGNLSAGGTGKTPTVIALLERLIARGVAVHVVSKGYGGRLEGPVRVDPAAHDASQTGDEPLLIAAFAPVWVAKNRVAGARAAVAAGAQAIVLDDGHQDPSLAKVLSIVVVDAARGFGNGRTIPAGPLREPIPAGLGRADLLLSIGAQKAQAQFETQWSTNLNGLPHLRAALRPLATGMPWVQMRVLAFAGIAYPQKFFETLQGLGVTLLRAEALDDHQPLTPALLHRLKREADTLGAQLVCTEKDAVRLPPELRTKVLPFPVRLHIAAPEALDDAFTRLGL